MTWMDVIVEMEGNGQMGIDHILKVKSLGHAQGREIKDGTWVFSLNKWQLMTPGVEEKKKAAPRVSNIVGTCRCTE